MEWTRSRGRRLPGREMASGSEECLAELANLAASAGADVAGCVSQRSPDPDPATLVGRGKVDEIRAAAASLGAMCVIFANDLTPTQLRNLEAALGIKVIDRTQLILDLFARRARTREGKLQVELAQLSYLLPRLGGRGTSLSRLGGGIGTRGPGEQKLEFDRRRLRARIQKLENDIGRVRAQRALHRDHRRQQNFFSLALVGYTNAGKSTLFNALTGSHVVSSPRLFATLDPTVRSIALPSRRKALLSDTVGFIHNLPPHLVASFRATLEELDSADLLVHVVDASHPDWAARRDSVDAVLETLGLQAVPRLVVWNKIDRLDGCDLSRFTPRGALVSASTGEGIDDLMQQLDCALGRQTPSAGRGGPLAVGRPDSGGPLAELQGRHYSRQCFRRATCSSIVPA